MGSTEWGSSDQVAWTKRDGYTPSPGGPRPWFLGAVAVTMIGVWAGIMTTDALCPDHRLWVMTLAWVALIGSITAVVGLFLHRSWAPLLTLGVALIGVAIGFIDAIHDATRGALISVAFAVVGVMLVVTSIPQLRSALLPRRAAREMRVDMAESAAPVGPVPTVTEERAIDSAGEVSAPVDSVHELG
jgi:hypothetical protein